MAPKGVAVSFGALINLPTPIPVMASPSIPIGINASTAQRDGPEDSCEGPEPSGS